MRNDSTTPDSEAVPGEPTIPEAGAPPQAPGSEPERAGEALPKAGSGRETSHFVLAIALVALAAVLICLWAVPAPFTIDEDNYLVTVLAAQHGQLAVPGTEGLPPSKELRYFCPQVHSIAVDSTPVHSVAPPLYAFIALPFSLGGWRGLVLLNAIAYALTAYLVYRHLRGICTSRWAPWLGLVVVALGSFGIEYAQGLWPQMLAVCLVFSGYLLARRSLEAQGRGGWALAFAAGLVAAAAIGIRYQNVVLVLGLGVVVIVFSGREWRSKGAGFALGALVPLAANSVLNHLRLGSWNPISKGGSYLSNGSTAATGSLTGRLGEMATLFWARVVDFRVRPDSAVFRMHNYIHHDESTGAYLIGSSVKKSLIQSAPWTALALVALVLAWVFWRRGLRHRRELRMLSLAVFPVLAMFSIAGANRTDGFCFNQRYLLELLPFLSVALVLSLEQLPFRWQAVFLGGAGSFVPLVLWEPLPAQHASLFMAAPLAVAAALVGVWLLRKRLPVSFPLGALLGVSLGWALAVHLTDDVTKSRDMRKRNLDIAELLGRLIPDHSAVFAWYGNKDPLGLLQMDRDVVIVDPHADNGKDAGVLAKALLTRKRRLFVVVPGTPREVLADVLRQGLSRVVTTNVRGKPTLIEVK